MSDTLQQVNSVLVSSGTNSAATGLPTITKGDLLIFDRKGNLIDTAAKATALGKQGTIQIAVGTGPGKFLLSSPIQGNTMSLYKGFAYAAPTEQVLSLGYDGSDTSKNFDINAGTEYRLRVNILADQLPGNGNREPYYDANYTASSSDDAADVALALQTLITATDYGHSFLKPLVSVEINVSGTPAAITPTVSVVKNSEVATFATAHSLSEGALITIAGKLYKVNSVIDATRVVLNAPYQGATAPAAAAANISAITNVGFELTALPQEESLAVYSEYEQILFDGFLSDADDLASEQYSAIKTKKTPTFAGTGYWKQVRDAEEFAKPYQGQLEKRSFDSKVIASNVDSASTYETLLINHAAIVDELIFSSASHAQQTAIYIPTGGTQGDDDTANSFINIMNAFAALNGFDAVDLVP